MLGGAWQPLKFDEISNDAAHIVKMLATFQNYFIKNMYMYMKVG